MKPIAIVTDSTSDLPPALAAQLHIHIVPCNVHFGQEVYRERVDLTTDQFYEKLAAAKELPKTSQPSVGVFREMYQSLAKEYAGIVSIHLAAKLSGTYQSAVLAAKEVTDIPIAAIDSGTTSMALGWLAVVAARASQARQTFESLVTLVNTTIPRTRLLALLENLDNVVKGGRIGKAAAFMGTMLNIKPLIEIKNGDVIPVERIRTWQKAKARLVELTKAFGGLDELAVMHAHAPDDAAALAEQLSEFYPRDRMVITEAGAVLGTHAGRGALGVMAIVR
jgi:DegV family protein with EDD domain